MKIYNWGKLFFLVLALIFIVNFSKDILRLWRAGDRLKDNQSKLEKLIKENFKLKQEIKFLNSDYFFEQQVRDKLGMAKPGEAIVFLPPMLENEGNERIQKNKEAKQTLIYKQWLDLFW